jgi:hypothetical protein
MSSAYRIQSKEHKHNREARYEKDQEPPPTPVGEGKAKGRRLRPEPRQRKDVMSQVAIRRACSAAISQAVTSMSAANLQKALDFVALLSR